MCSLSCIAERLSCRLGFCQWVTNGVWFRCALTHLTHAKVTCKSQTASRRTGWHSWRSWPLDFLCGLMRTRAWLLSYEEDGEINLRVKLMLRFSVEFIWQRLYNLLLARYWAHVWVQILNQGSVRLPMHIGATFLQLIILKKLGFAWSTLKLPFNCFIPSLLDEETTHVFLKPAT